MDLNAQNYSTSMLSAFESVNLRDNNLPEIIHSGLELCWQDQLFFDIEILTRDASVMSHKIVLASVSPFFRAAFSPYNQLGNQDGHQKINLSILSTSTMNRILEFIYTKQIEPNCDEVEELTIAANILQMSSLEKICSETLFEKFDKSRMNELLIFAANRNLQFLEDKCQRCIRANFRKELDSGNIFKLPVDPFENVVKHSELIVRDEKDCIPPSSIQEKIIFTTILKYVQLMNSDVAKESTLERLLKHVRFDLIMKFEYQSLLKEVDAISNKILASVCMQTLTKAVDVDKVKTFDEIKATGGQLPRIISLTHLSKTKEVARANVRNFDAIKDGFHCYVKGMKIWMQQLDDQPVCGAVEVLYSNGRKVFHGQCSNHEVYSFFLEQDEFIVEVVAFSGHMVYNLLFITNTGKKYGPYGGNGGGRRVFRPPYEAGYLASISGSEADTQGALGIVDLSFHWVSYDSVPPDGCESQECDSIPSLTDSDASDF